MLETISSTHIYNDSADLDETMRASAISSSFENTLNLSLLEQMVFALRPLYLHEGDEKEIKSVQRNGISVLTLPTNLNFNDISTVFIELTGKNVWENFYLVAASPISSDYSYNIEKIGAYINYSQDETTMEENQNIWIIDMENQKYYEQCRFLTERSEKLDPDFIVYEDIRDFTRLPLNTFYNQPSGRDFILLNTKNQNHAIAVKNLYLIPKFNESKTPYNLAEIAEAVANVKTPNNNRT